MGRPQRLTPEDRERVTLLHSAPYRWSNAQIADDIGVSSDTIRRFLKGRDTLSRPDGMPATVYQMSPATSRVWQERNPDAKAYSDLSKLATAALQDLPLFCSEILGEPLYPHQLAWHEEDLEREREGRHFIQKNAPPRHSKTDLYTNKRALWRLVGGGWPAEFYGQPDPPLRDLRVVLVAGSEKQSDKNFEYIQVRLSEHPKLVTEYGRFRQSGLVWKPSERVLTIHGRRRLQLSGDFSLVCVGTNTHFLGRGADDIYCDDPFDSKNCPNAEAAERSLRWLRNEVFSRLEPGGRIYVLGARLPMANDPYSQIAAWPGDLEENWDDDESAERMADGGDYPRLFFTTATPAVLDWEARTVLCPERWSWRQLMQARRLAGEEVWEATWMQNPSGGSDALARREWIYGGTYKGVTYPGCLDNDRRAGESIDLTVDTTTGREIVPHIRVLSIDPSDKKFWAFHCMDIFKAGGDYSPVLIDLERNKHSTSSALAVIDRWWSAYQFKVLVLERNIARFLIENEAFQDFLTRTRVKVIYHHTGLNKADAKWGIGTLARDFEAARIRIPNGDAETRWKYQYLIKEALSELLTDDTLLALWFPKWHLAGLMGLATAAVGWQGWSAPKTRGGIPPRLAKAAAR